MPKHSNAEGPAVLMSSPMKWRTRTKKAVRQIPSSPCSGREGRHGAGHRGIPSTATVRLLTHSGETPFSNPFLGPSDGSNTTAFRRRLEGHVLQGKALPRISGSSRGQDSLAGTEATANHEADRTTIATPAHYPEQGTHEDRRGKELNSMREKISRLQISENQLKRSEQRLKKLLMEKGELLKDAKVEAEEMRTEWLKAEERLEDKENSLQMVDEKFRRYRGWWLTEYYCLKVVLKLVSEEEMSGVEAIAASSQSRFDEHSK